MSRPDLLILRLHLHNRLAAWRAAPGEHLFVALASLGLLATLAVAGRPLLDRLAALPVPGPLSIGSTLLLLLVLFGAASWRDVRRALHEFEHGWLGASAWPRRDRRRALLQRTLAHTLLRLLLLAAAVLLWQMRRGEWPLPAPIGFGLLAVVALALLQAALLASLSPDREARPTAADPVVVRPVEQRRFHGLDLLRQGWITAPPRGWRIAATAALIALPGGLSGSSLLMVLALALVPVVLGKLFRHYQHTVVASAAWLQASPPPPRRLLAVLAWPLLRNAVLLLAAQLLVLAAGGMALALPLAVALLMLAALLLLALLAFAHRHAPRRLRLVAPVQLALLLLAVQQLGPLAVPAWLLLVMLAWRRALAPPIPPLQLVPPP